MEEGSVGARDEGARGRTRRRPAGESQPHELIAARPPTRGERVCAFIERYCRVPEGMHVGQPMKLAQFQRDFICAVYDNPHGTSLAILSMGRKNGKTALIAALLLAHLAGPEARPNSQIVSGAQSRDQAALVFELAAKMVRASPRLAELVRVVPSRKTMVGLALNVEYKALSAEARTTYGLSPTLAILDEIGQVRGPRDDFVDAITTAQGAHKEPLLICISTQAATDGDMLSLWIDDALRTGSPRTICHLHTAPADADIMDKDAWRAANPALGLFRSEDDIAEQSQKAKRLPSYEQTFRNLILNQRVEVNAPFVAKDIWKRAGRPIDESVFITQPVFAGLDLSSRLDLTALVLAARDEEGVIHLRPYFWAPEEGLSERARRDRVPYDVWMQQGFLRATPGGSIDYAFVAQEIAALVESGMMLGQVAFDRWRMDVFQKELERIGVGVELQPFGQGFKDFSPALDEFESCLVNDKLAHGDHPVLNMCAMNAVVRKDEAGNRKLDKKRASGRIDGMVAAVMAVSSLLKAEQNTESGLICL